MNFWLIFMKLLFNLIAVLMLLYPAIGFCGAWQLKPKEAQIIAGYYQDSEQNQSDGEIFIEYGLSSNISITGSHTQFVNKNSNEGYINNIGFKYGVYENNDWVSALKFTYIDARFDLTAEKVSGYSTSFLIGHNFSDKIWGSLELGNRNIDGNDNGFWDIAFGYKFNENSQIIIKDFGEQITQTQTRDILQLSYVHSFKKIGLELAYRKTMSAPINWDGHGVLTSIWLKY